MLDRRLISRRPAFGVSFAIALLAAASAQAMCDVIPGVTQEFRGALGSLDRPFALPNDEGEILRLRLARDPFDPNACDAASPGFPAEAADVVVTVVFDPPAGPSNAVVLASDCGGMNSDLNACRSQLGSGGATTCIEVNADGEPPSLVVESADQLRFRFPDTDALLGTPDDDRTLTGPAKIAVTRAGDSLPCGLATSRCADSPGLLACVDELYARDGTCETGASHIDATFGHFTALPPPNDYQALCTTSDPGAPCTGLANEVRFTVDAAGNALLPMDYRGVLVQSDQIPIPRLILGDTAIAAFSGTAAAVDLPSEAFIASYNPGGIRLPPVFTPISNPGAAGQLSLFGSVDAPVGVIRVTRQGCLGGAREGAACSADAQCGAGASCRTFFEFGDRLEAGVGPVLISESEFVLATQNPVPLDGLIESESMFAFVANEAIEGEFLNDDSDATDPVLRLRDRKTGTLQPIGTGGADGRAVTRVRDGRFRFPTVVVENDIVAFLELEPLEGDCANPQACDTNGNGSVFDPILRVYRVVEDCGDGTPCAEELTASLPKPIAVDADPIVEGRSLAVSDGIVYFRVQEWRQAPQLTERILPGEGLTALSSDGRVAAFGAQILDLETGETENIASPVSRLSLSSDGLDVAFDSVADDLDPRDLNSLPDIFAHDRVSGETTLVSVSSAGEQGGGEPTSEAPSLSRDGSVVAFHSIATHLVPGDSNFTYDIFVHDRDVDGNGIRDEPGGIATVRVSVSTDGTPADGRSSSASLSGDSRFVAFTSEASNLDAHSLSGGVFVHDRDLDEDGIFDEPGAIETTRASVASDGSPGDGFLPALSEDGSVVAFHSFSDNLVAGDTKWPSNDLFVHDRATGRTERIGESQSVLLTPPGLFYPVTTGPSLSFNGRLVFFEGLPFPGPPPGGIPDFDVVLHDRTTGATERVRVAQEGNGTSIESKPALSSDGRVALFARDLFSFGLLICPPVAGPCPRPMLLPEGSGLYVRSPDESDLASDLSSDGDLKDTLVAALDVSTGDVTMLCPAKAVAVNHGDAAFLRPMAEGPCAPGAGLIESGDDAEDTLVHLRVPGQGVENLERAASAIALSAELVGAVVHGASGGTEAQVYDRAAQGWLTTGEAADTVAVHGTTLAFTSPEAEAGADRNGDGDRLDRVLRIFRLEGGALQAVFPFPAPATEEFVLGERIVAFRTREASQGEDLNDDGDLDDDVLQVFDLVSERFFNTEQAVTPCPLEACDPRFPYRVEGDAVTFITSEAQQGGEDLNGDGDAGDLVKQVFNAREAALLAPLSGEAAACVDAIAAAVAGVCTTTGAGCVSDDDCGAGSCFLPPGGCIANLGTSCSCNGSGCHGCNGDQFCVPLSGAGGAGRCYVNAGPCASQIDCAAPAVCTNAEADIHRLFAPVADTGPGGSETVFSSGSCVDDSGSLCHVDADCSRKETCGLGGTCQRRFGSCRTTDDCRPGLTCAPKLVTVNAADADSDDLADPFDNCPAASNIDQADSDRDGVGDLCDLMTCGNGTREFSEQCDDGNLDDGDGCDARCTTPVGRVLAFFDIAVRNGSLVGNGPGNSGQGRLAALRNKIEAAANPGTAPSACGPLEAALSHTDGDPQPPDFATGPAAAELAQMIEDAVAELGCNTGPPACGGGPNAGVGLSVLLVLAGSIRSRRYRTI